MAGNLARLPNYTCRQTIDRMTRRGGPARPFQPVDSTRFEVAFLDGREYYARPGEERLSEIHDSMEYRRTHIGNNDFLLPYRSELDTQDIEGNAGHNYTRFDHCQEYVGTSVVQFSSIVPAE